MPKFAFVPLMIAWVLALVGCNVFTESAVAEGPPAKPHTRPKSVPADAAQAVFAGGCFWCVEAVFEELDGVHEVVSGYAGGRAETAHYKIVSTGRTKHAEAVKIYYDPAKISYQTLLEVHFATHDPTTLNRQGNDVGTQYRSAIFYHNDEQKAIAEQSKKEAAKDFEDPIITEITPLSNYYTAENYHQDYFNEEGHTNGYCQVVVAPKIAKFRKNYSDKLKEGVKK